MTRYLFTVHGVPAPQGSKRHVGNGRMIEMSKKVGPWREAVKAAVLQQDAVPEQMLGPVHVLIAFWFPRPKYHYRANGQLRPDAPDWMDKKPDIDKCVRSTLDALTDTGVIRDDSQVVELNVQQRYVTHAQPAPGAGITLAAVSS